MLAAGHPEEAEALFDMAQEDVERRYHYYQFLATRRTGDGGADEERGGRSP
jgi:hypothetical protein